MKSSAGLYTKPKLTNLIHKLTALIGQDALRCAKPIKEFHDALGDHLCTFVGYGVDFCPFSVVVHHDTHVHVAILGFSKFSHQVHADQLKWVVNLKIPKYISLLSQSMDVV